MRHRKSVKKLGRTAPHRKAVLANLATALFELKHIKTTEAKAKETRRFSERLITLAKNDTVHTRRQAFRRLRQKGSVKILFEEIAPQYMERNGGYTRVIKLGQRHGDGARMAIVELVGFDTAVKKKKQKDKAKEDKADKKKRGKPEPVEAEPVETTEQEGKEASKATAKKTVKKKGESSKAKKAETKKESSVEDKPKKPAKKAGKAEKQSTGEGAKSSEDKEGKEGEGESKEKK